MTANGFIQIAFYCVVVTLLVKPFGYYMTRVFKGERTFLSLPLRPLERAIYALSGVKEDEEQDWKSYGLAVLTFSLAGFLALYALQRLQTVLPFNPQHLDAVSPDLAFNTSVSFVTNTNWQSYTPETTMSYLTQMAGLTVHNFVSAATGIALAIALIRGFARRSARTIGNFWVDMTRTVLYVLLPIAIVVGLFFVWQGMPQNLGGYVDATTLEGAKQVIAQGPVASQEVIKILGTNGGGFFNANSAHPYENPNGFTNAFQILLVLCIPFGLAFTFGRYARNVRQGIAIFAAMAIVLVSGAAFAAYQEQSGNPALARAGATWTSTAQQSGGNMEGKSVRFGAIQSAQYGVATTGTSTGSVDSAHDSWTPLGGMVPMVLIQLGEITPGGVGSGLYGMLVFAILSVFIAGLMVGRTPEYLGKKIEAREVKLAALGILALPASILGFTAVSVLASRGQAGPLNPGPHGFSEILYAFSST